MSKLHEVLAVEGELAGLFKNILSETQVSFTKKTNLFQGFDKRYEPVDASKAAEAVTEHSEITESVPSKLEYMFGHVVKFLDCNLQKEAANQEAKADVVVINEDGSQITIATQLPATFLLGLETKLKLVRDVLAEIPTVAPGFTWEADKQAKLPGVYRRKEPEVRTKTEKRVKWVTIAPATDKHPAQVKDWTEDEVVGTFTTTHVAGMLTPHEKSQLLGRVDALARAVKQARQRANAVEVKNVLVGKAIADYILAR